MMLSALIVLTACGAGGSGQAPGNALDIPLVTAEGETTTLRTWSGRPTVVAFFASWCAPCRVELPELDRAAARYGDRVSFVAIGAQETVEESTSLLEELDISMDAAADPDGRLMEAYEIVGLPATLVLDPGGRLRTRLTGRVTEENVSSSLDAVLAAHSG
jgi:thiol-disulfide isomerase/thioredoxin